MLRSGSRLGSHQIASTKAAIRPSHSDTPRTLLCRGGGSGGSHGPRGALIVWWPLHLTADPTTIVARVVALDPTRAPGAPGNMLRGALTVGIWTMASRIAGFARDI